MSAELRAQRDLIDQILELSDEREAAYAERETDPDRWRAAKQAYAESRRFWRSVNDYRKAVERANRSASPGAVGSSSTVSAPGVKGA